MGTLKAGDGHKINAKEVERPPALDSISKVARAAGEAGFVNLLAPTGTHCMDGRVTAAAVGRHDNKMKFCVAFCSVECDLPRRSKLHESSLEVRKTYTGVALTNNTY